MTKINSCNKSRLYFWSKSQIIFQLEIYPRIQYLSLIMNYNGINADNACHMNIYIQLIIHIIIYIHLI